MFSARKRHEQELALTEIALANEEAARIQAEVDTAHAVIARIDAENTKRAALWRVIEQTKQANEAKERLEVAEKKAITDRLTGLANRHGIHEEFDGIIQAKKDRHEHHRTTDFIHDPREDDLALIVMDVDHFTRFNTTQGHKKGDQVLGKLGSILIENTRGNDIPARWGGEEFAVLMPRMTVMEAMKRAEELRSAIENSEEDITASFGVVGIRLDADELLDLDDYVDQADAAMYHAKQMGRNCVVQYEPGMVNPNKQGG